jgi:hypothetical protein
MTQITNKIKLFALLCMVFVASLIFISCGGDKKTEESETTVPDTTEVITPDLSPDSLPVLNDSTSPRPEPRKTKAVTPPAQ